MSTNWEPRPLANSKKASELEDIFNEQEISKTDHEDASDSQIDEQSQNIDESLVDTARPELFSIFSEKISESLKPESDSPFDDYVPAVILSPTSQVQDLHSLNIFNDDTESTIIDENLNSQDAILDNDIQNIKMLQSVSAEEFENEVTRFWPLFNEMWPTISTDKSIQDIAKNLKLTRDKEEDAIQMRAVTAALKYVMGTNNIIVSSPSDIPFVMQMVYDELLGISVLGRFWRDDSVTEIMVDSWDRVIIERAGVLEETGVRFQDATHADGVAKYLARMISGRQVSKSMNLVSAMLPKARIQIIYGDVVKTGLAITIRKFFDLLDLKTLKSYGTLNDEMERFLKAAVRERASILISGGTGTGKTTIINLLSSFIPDTERVVTIEDVFELSLSNMHVVSLQTKEAASADDTSFVTLSQLLRSTLRLRPDRIIVGEIREGEGAVVMLAAANTGHEGTMTTTHANSADFAVNERIPDLIREDRPNSSDDVLKRTIASAFDLVIQIERGRKGNRFISNISQIDRSFIVDGIIVPVVLFKGVDNGNGTVTFSAVSKVRPDTIFGKHLFEDGYEELVAEESE